MADNRWQTQMIPVPGLKGLDMRTAVDKVDPAAAVVMTNLRRDQDGRLQSRPGQQLLATTAYNRIHSVRRLEVPTSQQAALAMRTFRIDEFDQQGDTALNFSDLTAFALLEFAMPGAGAQSPGQYTSTRFWGADSSILVGAGSTLTAVDSGYSGDPVCFLPYRPPLSPVAWMHVADRLRMRRFRPDGLAVPLGLPAPVGRLDAEVVKGSGLAYLVKPLSSSISGTVAFEWTLPANASKFFLGIGSTRDAAVSGPPNPDSLHWAEYTAPTNTASVAGLPATALYVALWTFYPVSGWNVQPLVYFFNGAPGVNPVPLPGAKTIDTFTTPSAWSYGGGTGGSGTLASSAARPGSPEGTGNTATAFSCVVGAATGAYHSWFYRAHASGLDLSGDDEDPLRLWLRPVAPPLLSEIVVWFVISPDFDGASLPGTGAANSESFKVVLDGAAFNPAQSAWNEWGGLDLPLKRKDAKRFGTTESYGWNTVTGIIIDFSIASPDALTVACDDWTTGSNSRLDSTPVGAVGYDWRYTHYDPRTGDESNPSTEWYLAQRLKVNHDSVLLKPEPYGDTAVRQRFYRRGGSLVEDWYFVGDNEADGGQFLDVFGDDEIQASRLLEIDNFQAIPTTGADGETILAQPIPVLVGPVQGIVLGLGDPMRPGDLVWCKPGNTGAWPPGNRTEVCDASEELMNGAVWGGQAYLYSRERMYAAYPNLTGTAAIVTTTPTANPKGLVSRYALCVGPDGMYQVARDGVYRNTGGEPTALTDGALWPIFHGEWSQVGAYAPIDFSATAAAEIRLECYDNEIWLTYRGTDGLTHTLIWSIIFQYWRHYGFSNAPAVVYAEEFITERRLILGGRNVGKAWELGGTSDDGQAITAVFRGGALDQSAPRELKLYGDVVLDADLQACPVNARVWMDNEINPVVSAALNSEALSDDAAYPPTASSGVRKRYTLDICDTTGAAQPTGPRKGRNISLQFDWTSAAVRPSIYAYGVSFEVQPELTAGRPSTWDYLGAVVDKRVKGLVLECDTFGAEKVLSLQADNTQQAQVTVQAAGRQIVQVAFQQFVGRLLRIKGDSRPWILYAFRWIFDEEPLKLARWESQEVNHGLIGWQKPLFAYVTLLSDSEVRLTLRSYGQAVGDTPAPFVETTYDIASTGGVKAQVFVPFRATKGVLFKYTFTGKLPFHLYREESQVTIEPWGAKEAVIVKPFGSDDLDLVRKVFDAEGLSGRTGYPYPQNTQVTLSGNAAPPVEEG